MPWRNGADADIPITRLTGGTVDLGGGRTWPETERVAGYFVNLPASPGLAEALAEYAPAPPPATLQRVYAGDDPANPTMTVPLRFSDEAEAKSVLGPMGYWQAPLDGDDA